MSRDVVDRFHPAVANWFRASFAAPTGVQAQAWPAIAGGRHVLVAAPTGSGKTLAAFLAALDALVREGVQQPLPDATRVVYVSPLKALSNDIQRNLEMPLAGIRAELAALGLPEVDIRTLVRSGDTPQAQRAAMRRRPPHIVVTTPESLYLLMTSESGRQMLAGTRSVIVDEIHALAGNKRGAHLALTLERLAGLAGPLARIGLSATQRPIEDTARFLVGAGASLDEVAVIDAGHVRERDLALELPEAPLEAVMSGEVWEQTYDRLAALARDHRTTLVFVNTRRLAERAARHLSERLGVERVAAHHGSLAREHRLRAEQRLKSGELQVLVATASLELGIDVGEVDLVCQIGSPHSIAAFLQRVGRSGHRIGALPKGRLFPLSRDDLAECAALLDAVRRGELDRLRIPAQPLDVLAQQIVAECACRPCGEDELYALVRRAWPYRELARTQFDQVVRMLAEGIDTPRGRRHAHLHRDAANRVLRGRRGARLTALTGGGTIPDTADYQVLLEPQAQVVGTVNEDFAVESLAGDVFQLGNTAYRILRIERGTVRVEDAQGAAPGIPFWFGEAPGRSDVLSAALSRLREDFAARCSGPREALVAWLVRDLGIGRIAAGQLADYYLAARAALGVLPSQKTVALERFFDESGGMQLVIHSPYGSRINRAWGLALRKRFCRKFNFELQAAATEDTIVLSLATSHSFPLEEVARYLDARTVRPLLVQALLAAPMFATRWRWNATVALALPRMRGGAKVPPQLLRMQAEDLLAAVFPDQVACGENIVGDREVPDHPLVNQTIADCLFEAMDVEGLERLLAELAAGRVGCVARDLTEPSPLAVEVLGARPYAFLDDAPLEERRTQAVMARRWLDPETAADLGRLDAAAIRRVREEAWPEPRDPEELHGALLELGFLTGGELAAGEGWVQWFDELGAAGRACRLALPATTLCVAAERLPELAALFPQAARNPAIRVPEEYRRDWPREEALRAVLRDRLAALGPVRVPALAASLGIDVAAVRIALAALEAEGTMMRGRFSPDASEEEWCERRLLARIHRCTVDRLRQEIEPVAARHFLRFLLRWQRVAEDTRMEGPDAVAVIVAQLEGCEAAAGAWETELLPARIRDYDPAWLDELSLAGRAVWTRLGAGRRSGERVVGPLRSTPMVLATRRALPLWASLAGEPPREGLSARAAQVRDFLALHGASFFAEIVEGTGLLRTQAEEVLAELAAAGQVSSDSFGGLRALLLPSDRRKPLVAGARRRRRSALFGIEDAGRWALLRRPGAPPEDAPEQVARTLLRRYGVVFWRLLAREPDWLPPWRELLRALRRLEARGEIRGGRFVAGMFGEQFALPEAVTALREARRQEAAGELISVSGADPLNLAGIVTPGPRLPALAGNRLLYRDGVPIALLAGGEVRFLETLPAQEEWQARGMLLRSPAPAELARFLA
jgi:ATP-dependent Lhr-like helicase